MDVCRGLDSSACAAWVQAWGSLLAVAAAAIGIWWQVRVQAKQRIQELRRIEAEHEKARVAEEVRRLAAIAGVLFQCIVTVKRAEEASKRRMGLEVKAEIETLLRHVSLLAGIPALDVPDLYAAYAIAESRVVCATLAAGLDSTSSPGPIDLNVAPEDRLHHRRSGFFSAATSNFLALEETLRTCLKQRGSDLPVQTATLNDTVLHSTRLSG